MGIIEKEIQVTLNGRTLKHYEDLGYVIPKVKGKRGNDVVPKGTKLIVKVEDLLLTSAARLTKIFDDCGKILPNKRYLRIMSSRKENGGVDRCQKCANRIKWDARYREMEYEQSLEHFALTNDKRSLLDDFSKKNGVKTSQVFKSSNKLFIWSCKACGSEYDMSINKRINGRNCPYCSGYRVNETNSLWVTHPEVAKLLSDPVYGHKITSGHNGVTKFVCDKCGNCDEKTINNVTKRGFVCSFCSDGVSFPEKTLVSILNQLNIKYYKQKAFKWSKRKIYDFYIPSEKIIIETHGDQHYRRGFEFVGGRTLEEEKENDKVKEVLAKENGITEYIVLDCRRSEINFIKNNILNSELVNYFDLDDIDWKGVLEFACNTYVKLTSDLWNSSINDIDEIATVLNISKESAKRYLLQAERLGWCKEVSKYKVRLI